MWRKIQAEGDSSETTAFDVADEGQTRQILTALLERRADSGIGQQRRHSRRRTSGRNDIAVTAAGVWGLPERFLQRDWPARPAIAAKPMTPPPKQVCTTQLGTSAETSLVAGHRQCYCTGDHCPATLEAAFDTTAIQATGTDATARERPEIAALVGFLTSEEAPIIMAGQRSSV